MARPATDLRLAAPVAGLWLGTGLWLADELGWQLACGVALLLGSGWLWRRRRGWQVFAGFGLLGFALAVLRCTLLLPALPLTGQHDIEFEINGDGQVRSAGFGALDFRTEWSYPAELRTIDGKSVRHPVRLTLPTGDWSITARGSCRAGLQRAEGRSRIVGFVHCKSPPQLLRSANRLQFLANRVRTAGQVAVAGLQPRDGAALLPGLVLGDTSRLAALDAAAMQRAGLGHLTAVSGANVAVMLLAVQYLLSRLRLRLAVRIGFLLLAVAGFVVVVRPTASVVRAAVMAAIALLVLAAGRRGRGEVMLLAASLLLLIIDPWLAASWGFALSVAATAGLVLLAPKLHGPSPNWLRTGFAIALAACLATLPVLVLMGAVPTFASIPANLLAELLVAPATVCGLAAAMLLTLTSVPLIGAIATLIGRVLAQVGVWSAGGILFTAKVANDSWLSLPIVSVPAGLAMCSAGLFWLHSRKLGMSIGVLLAVVGLTAAASELRPAWPPAGWQLIACDVAQGDATLIRADANTAVLVDAGADPLLLNRCLRRARIGQVVLFVASHFHADHVGGVLGLAAPPQVWLGCGSEPAAGRRLVQQSFAASQLRQLVVGEQGQFGAAALQVLACPASAGGDGSSVNNSSLVLAVMAGGRRLLLAGDAEQQLQESVMQQVAAQQFDIVKLPHHGSLTQADDFAAWTGAKLGWVSVGADNSFGHPAAETMRNYARAGVLVWRTSSCGDIAFTADSVVPERRCSPG